MTANLRKTPMKQDVNQKKLANFAFQKNRPSYARI